MSQEFKYCPVCAAPLIFQIFHKEKRLSCSEEPRHYIHYDNPKPVVAAIVEYEGEVLLARNARWPPEWFALITGFLEKDETPEEGIVREVKEEIGLDAEVQSLVGVYPFLMRNEVIMAYHVIATGEVVLDDEIAAVKKIPKNELIPWPYGTGDAVRDWLRKQNILDNIDKTLKFK